MPDVRTALGGMHERRVRRMLLLGNGITAATSIFWGVFFALRGNWFTVGLDLIAVAMATTSVLLMRRGHTRAASLLLIGVLYGVLLINAALFDVPTPAVPRSAHQFLLALGILSCLLMRQERPWLRHGIPLVCMLTYLAFAATNLGWVTPLVLPESIRAPGAWINHAIAVATVYATLLVVQTDVAERNGLEAELRDGLVRGELLLHYQPQLATVAGQDEPVVVGAEALVRWNHPQRGMVSPAEFIPLAESSGLMLPLGDWVLRTACAQLALWRHRPETASLVLAVNVSASQFVQPDFVTRVLASIEQAGADASKLKLELTESMLAQDLDDIIAKMATLKARGVGFSLDDFGTGFSSLSYLRRLPLDQLKIDQSFVRAMLNSPSDAAIAKTVVDLGQSLGLQVIAEGVETDAEHSFLASIGCTMYQGYLFSRPVGVAGFDEFVHARVAARG